MSEGEGADRQRGTVKGRAGARGAEGGQKERKNRERVGLIERGRHKVELELFFFPLSLPFLTEEN